MNSGGMAELVEDGVTGTLINQPTPEGVADAVRKTMEDEEHYKMLRENCKNQENILFADKYCDILINKYNEIIARGQKG